MRGLVMKEVVVRGLEAEIDELKARIEKLEKKWSSGLS